MSLDPKVFFNACYPNKTLDISKPEDKKFYIDFSPVRGAEVINDVISTITWAEEKVTCQLFTGHTGCGKSTELLRLKSLLEKENFHVVYFEINSVLDMHDVDISDILIAVASKVMESLKPSGFEITHETAFKPILEGLFKVLREIGITIPLAPLLSANLFNLLAYLKESRDLRSRLRHYLEPQTGKVLNTVNQELLEPAKLFLERQGKKGPVMIVDNLDRIENTIISPGKTQSEYLFADRGEQLKSLGCHLVYTIPLWMIFSKTNPMIGKFDANPHVLPMIPVFDREHKENPKSMELLNQMVLTRAFPDEDANERVKRMAEIFDSPETLARLCRISGGHVRGLLRLLQESIRKQKNLPISEMTLEQVISENRNKLAVKLSERDWAVLREVKKSRKISEYENFQELLKELFILEYRDNNGSWFDVNPIIADAKEFRSLSVFRRLSDQEFVISG